MKSTVAHAAVTAIITAAALVGCKLLVFPISHGVSDVAPHSVSLLAAPLVTLSQLLPGLALGWFTRRHPLLVGALAGILASIAAQYLTPIHFETYSLVGESVALGMTVAVATLAGRALRRRFDPAAAAKRVV
jgi:hypothetical protein